MFAGFLSFIVMSCEQNGVYEPLVQNIICTVNLNCPLALPIICEKFPDTSYNRQRFSGLVLKIAVPKSTMLLFSTGKVVCVGTKTICAARKAIDVLCIMLGELGYNVHADKFTVVNIVGSFTIGLKIRVEDSYNACRTVGFFRA